MEYSKLLEFSPTVFNYIEQIKKSLVYPLDEETGEVSSKMR